MLTGNFNFVPNSTIFQKLPRIFRVFTTQTTCFRIEVKPERSRKLCHIFSHRTGTMWWNIFRRSTLVTMHLSFLQIGVNHVELKKKLPYDMSDKIKLLYELNKYASTCMAQTRVWADLTVDYFTRLAFWLQSCVTSSTCHHLLQHQSMNGR